MSEGAVVVEMSSKMSEVAVKKPMRMSLFIPKKKSVEPVPYSIFIPNKESVVESEEEAERLMRRSLRIRRVVIVLAALEQAATHLAKIAFLGATVVLLGGYAPRLKLYDFVLISALLLSAGVRVFLASQNVEYTRATGGPFAGNWGPGIFVGPWLIALGYFTRGKRKPIIPIFQVLQVGSAAVTFAFSLSRLKSGNYKPTLSSPSDAGEIGNFVYGIRLFYILTLVESSVFLVVKAVAWDLLTLLLSVEKVENEDALLVFAFKIYGVFLSEGFGKASTTNFFTFIINFLLENKDEEVRVVGALKVLRLQIPDEARTSESIKCLIRLTAPGQPENLRRCASQILVVMLPEFGRIPLEVVDIEAVSKQASTFLITSILDEHDKAALTFLKWWSDRRVYREYGFDPADIFYRLYIDRRERVGDGLDSFNLEAAFEYEAIAEPIRRVFSRALTPRRSDIMNKLLSSVDFSKLKNKQSTINLSGIAAEVFAFQSEKERPDFVVGLVAAWIWFMDESTFEKAISNLTKEELGMLKKNTLIYSAILRSKNDLKLPRERPVTSSSWVPGIITCSSEEEVEARGTDDLPLSSAP